jgi:hypothetical protein
VEGTIAAGTRVYAAGSGGKRISVPIIVLNSHRQK